MYVFKKLIGFLVTPLVFCSIFQALGLLAISQNKRKVGFWLCGVGLSLLLILSTPAVGEKLMGNLETHVDASLTSQPKELVTDVEFVVVLSGGFHTTQAFSPASRLAPDTLRRLVDGMALARQLPKARLLLSGGILISDEKPAAVMGELAVSLGWDPARLLLESDGKTTAEQAQHIKSMVGDSPFYLVTSANHMPRAMEHFGSEGLQPIPYPCDHIVQTPTLGLQSWVPSIYGLALSNAAIHEWVGRFYGWLVGN